MTYTKFGEFLRILRVKRHETMKDMAKILNVSPAFLSMVEHGKKLIPKTWCEKIINHYQLDPEEQCQLRDCMEMSIPSVKLNLANASDIKRKTVYLFAKDFGKMTDETAIEIMRILNTKGKEKK